MDELAEFWKKSQGNNAGVKSRMKARFDESSKETINISSVIQY